MSQMIDIRKVAGTGDRQTESVRDRLGSAQLAVAEGDGGILDRFVIVLRHGPRHDRQLLVGPASRAGLFFRSRSTRGTYCPALTRVPMSKKRITDTRSALNAKPWAPSLTANPSARAASRICGGNGLDIPNRWRP